MATQTLKYGMKIQLFAKSPLSADQRTSYGVTLYEKHNLMVLDEGKPLTFTVLSTTSTGQDVCYGDRLILADENGLVWNSLDTNTWGKGYITLKDKTVSGELHFIFNRPSQPLIKGSPISLADSSSGGKIAIQVLPGKGSSQKLHALTIDKKTSSAVKGGYLRSNGSGSPVFFDIVVVDNPVDANAPTVSTTTAAASPIPSTPGVGAAAPHITTTSPAIIPPTPGRPGAGGTGGDEPRRHSVSTIDGPGQIEINTGESTPGHGKTTATAPSRRSLNPAGDKPTRPMNPDPYNVQEELEPLRYGDRIKLFARSAYNADGGYVGVYHKHNLIGVGPVIHLKTGRPLGDEDGACKEFTPSEFVITSSGRARTGDIVRYNATVVLVDVVNGNMVWNCKDTDTWGEGYITEAPMSSNSAILPPNTPGPPLVSSNFPELTGNGRVTPGQIHVSLQPDSPVLFGYPVHNNDKNVFVDVENTHQKSSKYNSRLSVYRRKSSQLYGGYVICLPNAGKPVSFTLERVQAVSIPRRDPYSGDNALVRSTGYVQETETAYRRENNSSLERRMITSALITIAFGLLTVGYALARHDIGDVNSYVALLGGGDGHADAVSDLMVSHHEELLGQLYNRQVFYMVCTFISALFAVYFSSTAINYAPKRVKVQIERNDLAHLSHSLNEPLPDPNQWMIDAGIEIDTLVVPKRYIDAEKGDATRGQKRYLLTMKWRHVNQLDSILNRPHPLFRVIKKYTNQFFQGKGKDGNCVYYETPKSAKLADFQQMGVTLDELLFHFVYITEFLYQVLDTRPEARCISVVDCSGIGISDLTGEVAEFLKAVSNITQTHYPERSAGIICINAPFSFRLIWNIVKGMMDPVTRSKTHIYGGSYVAEMSKYIDKDQIPEQFGGDARFTPTIPAQGPLLNPKSIDNHFNRVTIEPLSPEEEQMFKIADKVNHNASINGDELPRTTLINVGTVQDLF